MTTSRAMTGDARAEDATMSGATTPEAGGRQLSAAPVSISASAARRIEKVLAGEAEGTFLRISVEGGGCSGFQYRFGFDTVRSDDDLVLRRGDAMVVIDAVSVGFLEGAEIDFVDDLVGQSFRINNPNATASCGCGTSFSI